MSANEEVLFEVIGDVLSVDNKAIRMNSDLSNDYGMTSINLLMIVTTLCEKLPFDIASITEQDLSRINTPEDLALLFFRGV